MEKLSCKIEPEKLDSKYFYEYIHENIEHIKDVIQSELESDEEDIYDDSNLRLEVLNKIRKKRKLDNDSELLIQKTIKLDVKDEINDNIDVLTQSINKIKLNKKYITILFYYDILCNTHEEDKINTCSLNMFIQKDNSIKSYSNFIKYKTIKEEYIDKTIDFSFDNNYECRILLLNKKLNIKSEINYWYERIACFDLTSNNIFQCILNDDLGINQYIFNETINIKKNKYNILKKIIENLV